MWMDGMLCRISDDADVDTGPLHWLLIRLFLMEIYGAVSVIRLRYLVFAFPEFVFHVI